MAKLRTSKRRERRITQRARELYRTGGHEKICKTSENGGFLVDKALAEELGLLVLVNMPDIDGLIKELEQNL
tara:strand:+ start:375 stop:590 length:216 start_codon:yes stop_codon:yes gene_type:complete